MTTQNEISTIVNEIIDNASALPPECQDLLLAVAKGMAFTKSCISKQHESTVVRSLAPDDEQIA